MGLIVLRDVTVYVMASVALCIDDCVCEYTISANVTIEIWSLIEWVELM